MTTPTLTITDMREADTLQLYSVEQVAGLLQVDASNLRRLANKGEIGSVRIGKRILFHRQDVMRFIRASHRPAR
jgi:excisionase family DNA binding protein